MEVNMDKKTNAIFILFIFLLIITFLLGFTFGKSSSKDVQNQNISQNVNINTTENKKINLNTSTKAELMSINSIGDKKADLIIKNRPYKSIWDLSKIDGISEEFIYKIQNEVSIDAES
jgi:competence protein ComEA